MATLTSRLVISLLDRASGPARRIASSMSRLRAAQGAISGGVLGATPRERARNRRAFQTVTGGNSGLAGWGATAGAYGLLRTEYEYQQAMNRTQAILNITDEKAFKPHRDLVIDLAERYPATSAEVAKGASELAMAGMSIEQVNEVLEATVQGALATGESIKNVGMGVTDVALGLGMKLTKENFEQLNNVMAAASTAYSQDYMQFLSGFYKTAPIARMLGLRVERLAGFLGILADAGFKAEKGGTALRTSMVRAAAPTKKALDFLSAYGVDLSKFRKRVDTFQLGGPEGAKALSDFVAEQLNIDDEGFDISGALTPILNDPKAFKDIPKLKKRLSAAIRDAIGQDSPQDAKLVAESVSRFIESGFQQLDFEGLMRRLAEIGLDKNVEAMKELFGIRFTAAMGSIMDSIRSGNFDFKLEEVFLPRIEGAVKRFADILMKGLPGAVQRLAGAFDKLLRSMASSGAIDTVVDAMNKLRDGINWLSKRSPTALKAITLGLIGLGVLAPVGLVLSGVAAAVTLLGGAIMRLVRATRLLAGVGGAGLGLLGSLLGIGTGAAGGKAVDASAKMIAGMSGAGGAAVGKKLGVKFLARLIGWPLALAMAGYESYEGYQKDGWKGAILNPLTFGLYSGGDAEAAEAPDGAPGAAPDGGLSQVQQQAQAIPAAVQSAMAQVQSIVGSVDLTAQGARIAQSLANGIRSGTGAIAAAARDAAQAAQVGSAMRGAYSDGGR
ncbi:MAG: phage tail tape measure protein [Hyphomicrobium sp.]